MGKRFVPDTSREWLEADGLGGFSSGTAGAIRTRRYHFQAWSLGEALRIDLVILRETKSNGQSRGEAHP
jgi:hypothetical protein